MTRFDQRHSSAQPMVATTAGVLIMTPLALVAVGMIWWIAVPVGPEVCSLVLPGPRNCFTHDRLVAATVWTVVIALAYLAAIVATVLSPHRRLWFVGAGIVLMLLVGAAGFVAAAWIPTLA
ncbi:hypothetical protein NQ166_07160 [Microbacterium sp. zg.Y1090]|uniref:hypothetical protein n=1 Tax=Microbacterium TaxID=33882 RepID=UPI00214CC13F|nr:MULTISPECIES: hypothetical protein [unclassified Microbacterium]MCR2811944.1 hypothetical protein [Microbacterium sp. zg.Y1084]MCR2818617.1 hypothetical protein [Microbacterium sp. zg.Y1090]MDL5486430.1 hypothetical protein [Microbacterium sp. zg-Y1211]WIM29617.1 hypothetical protein QNO26_06970 [Microbacterium sp. zg-Y1090]